MLSFLLMTIHFFSVVHNMNTSAINLNNDLNKIRDWAIQWKMNFNFGLANKLRKLYFQGSIKRQIIIQFILITTLFNKIPLNLGMCLDSELNFQEHINNLLSKVNKTIGFIA